MTNPEGKPLCQYYPMYGNPCKKLARVTHRIAVGYVGGTAENIGYYCGNHAPMGNNTPIKQG